VSDVLKILVPSDGSPAADRAVAHAVTLAGRGLQLELHLLNVQLPMRGSAARLIAKAELQDYHREEGMKALESARRIAEAGGLVPQLHVAVGDPGETVVAFASRLGCTEIIMGNRGLGAASGLLGSVSQYVVSAVDLPVTLLRAP